MSCKNHSGAQVAGVCNKCGSDYCSDCSVPMIDGEKGRTNWCLDCGVSFAKKKIMQSYIAAAIGSGIGIFAITDPHSPFGAARFLMPIIYAYLFWGTFFGWHFGGRIWPKLGRAIESWHGMWGLVLLSFRFAIAVIVGIFGGGIYQFLLYKKTLNHDLALRMPGVSGVAT